MTWTDVQGTPWARGREEPQPVPGADHALCEPRAKGQGHRRRAGPTPRSKGFLAQPKATPMSLGCPWVAPGPAQST